jgi:predicted Fe-Mo cluster-binding NifX family protein
MIIAIASTENHLKSSVDQHFGRCDWYFIYDTESKKSTFLENPVRYNKEKAGCDAADILIDKGVKIVFAGRFGSKVVEVFRNKNIQMVIPEGNKTIKEIINQIK